MPVNYLTGKTLTYAILLLGLHGDLSAVLCLGVSPTRHSRGHAAYGTTLQLSVRVPFRTSQLFDAETRLPAN